MVVNKKGGKKAKKQKNNPVTQEKRKLVFKDILELQEYAQISKLLGSARFEVECFDGKTRLATVRGNMRKKVWVKAGDVVMVSLREFEDSKCDIIYLYKSDEVKSLKSLGELPSSVKVNEDITDKEEVQDIGFDFVEEEEDDEIKKKDDFKKDFEEKFESI